MKSSSHIYLDNMLEKNLDQASCEDSQSQDYGEVLTCKFFFLLAVQSRRQIEALACCNPISEPKQPYIHDFEDITCEVGAGNK
mmetsp:Transcript_19890/g.14620  ORF Transcript_19890/g.14620 Transcript_19890/m.14620 type:complete len:83 (-) Transcript_19890:1057-1305(-)